MRAVLRVAFIAVIVFGAANAKADRIRVAVQKTGTLAWELDVIKRHGIERKLDLIIDNPRACIDRSGQGGAQGRLGRPHSLRLVVGCSRALAWRYTRVLSCFDRAWRGDDTGAVVDPQRPRPQGQEARHRGRSARQELASAPGVCAARRHRFQKAGRHRLRCAAVAVAEGAPGRDRRDPDLLEFLRRSRTEGSAVRWRCKTSSVASGRRGRSRSSVTPSTAIGPAAIPPLSSDFSRQYIKQKKSWPGPKRNGNGSRRISA